MRWSADVPLVTAENDIEIVGFDGNGNTADVTSITVTNPELSTDPRVVAWFPDTGPAEGGTEVSLVGSHLEMVTGVFFGAAPALSFKVVDAATVTAVSPPAMPPLPADFVVDIRLELANGGELIVARAFEYTGIEAESFVRADANLDGFLEVSDALTVLLYLYEGASSSCLEALDADGSGTVELTDGMTILNHIYLSGAAPPAPYPDCGIAAELLGCESGACR